MSISFFPTELDNKNSLATSKRKQEQSTHQDKIVTYVWELIADIYWCSKVASYRKYETKTCISALIISRDQLKKSIKMIYTNMSKVRPLSGRVYRFHQFWRCKTFSILIVLHWRKWRDYSQWPSFLPVACCQFVLLDFLWGAPWPFVHKF